jgi:hypothetical protein
MYHVLKDVILVAAVLVLAATVRGGRSPTTNTTAHRPRNDQPRKPASEPEGRQPALKHAPVPTIRRCYLPGYDDATRVLTLASGALGSDKTQNSSCER